MGSFLLTTAGGLLFAVSILHFAIPFFGSKAYGYFGAAQLIPMEEKGSHIPKLLTLILGLVFGVCAFYELSGAGLIPSLPLAIPAILAIGFIFTLRGIRLIFELPQFFRPEHSLPPRALVFSGVAMLIGILTLAGLLLE